MFHKTGAKFVVAFLVALEAGCGTGTEQARSSDNQKGPADNQKGQADKPSDETGPVILVLSSIDKPGLGDVKQGDTITIKGSCGSLRDGKIVLSIGTPYRGYRPAIAAPDLVKEFTSGPERAYKKYKEGTIVVVGVVRERTRDGLIISGTRTPKPVKGDTVDSLESPVAKASPAFSLTSDEFEAEYKQDAKAADKKYGGKIIDLSGTVNVVGQDASGDRSFVTLKTKSDILGVYCITISDQPWSQVSSGQKVRLRGTCPPKEAKAFLVQCIVVDKDKSAATVEIASDKLAEEFAKSQGEAQKKYDGKTLIVTGEVVAKSEEKNAGAVLALKGNDKIVVECAIGLGPETTQANIIPVGGRVKIVGDCSFSKNKIRIGIPCHFIYDAP